MLEAKPTAPAQKIYFMENLNIEQSLTRLRDIEHENATFRRVRAELEEQKRQHENAIADKTRAIRNIDAQLNRNLDRYYKFSQRVAELTAAPGDGST